MLVYSLDSNSFLLAFGYKPACPHSECHHYQGSEFSDYVMMHVGVSVCLWRGGGGVAIM